MGVLWEKWQNATPFLSSDPFESLAFAIVAQAFSDYKRVQRGRPSWRGGRGYVIPYEHEIASGKHKGETKVMFRQGTRQESINELVGFFRSGWCFELCGLEYERIMELLER